MKWRETLCLVLVAAAGVGASGAQRVESDQQALIKLERDWNDAFYTKDIAFIESLLAPEFTATYDDGSRGDKAKELALTKEFDQQVESAVQDDFTVKVFGNSAVVWFTLKLVGIKQGQKSELALSYTDVWILRDDRWLCVSTQSTRVTSK
jgi:ketosteroid isomerase-like protein